MEKIKSQYKDYKLYTKIQQDSKDLSLTLKRNMKNFSTGGTDMFIKRNQDSVSRHLKAMDQYIIKQDVRVLRAKDFPPHHTWFNVAEPLSFDYHLKGKLVLIDFWTYCCINCLHVLPDLEYLEQKYEQYKGIAFMGCHSAKFANEREAQKVRNAILKYNVQHPVINDDQMLVWRNFERKSWPSLLIVNPKGVPIFILSGEGHRQVLDLFLAIAYRHYEQQLNKENTIPLHLEEEKKFEQQIQPVQQMKKLTKEQKCANSQNLKFPSKIICIEKQDGIDYPMLGIADSGNNRIVIINISNMKCVDVIGSATGEIGLIDGNFQEACFHHPQGMCHVYRQGNHYLYVCDTENHAIREINLNTKEVLTVLGTGQQGYDKEGNKPPNEQKLSSPWDIVAINRDTLIFAMAGTHQIWALNLKTNKGFNFSGSGKEGNFNDKRDLKLCEWAQPSGLSLGIISDSKVEIYVADSESSAIRSINMKTLQASRVLVGGDKNPKNLHSFGDEDGKAEEAKLQHPLGVAFITEKNVVAVTDTYNHKIKVIDPFNNEIFSWLGNGRAELKDEQTFDASLNEPSGIASIYDSKEKDIRVFIADCNNHCIRSVFYDQGIVLTPQFHSVPRVQSFEEVKYEEDLKMIEKQKLQKELQAQQISSKIPQQQPQQSIGKIQGKQFNDKQGANTTAKTTDTADTTGTGMDLVCDGDKCYPKFF